MPPSSTLLLLLLPLLLLLLHPQSATSFLPPSVPTPPLTPLFARRGTTNRVNGAGRLRKGDDRRSKVKVKAAEAVRSKLTEEGIRNVKEAGRGIERERKGVDSVHDIDSVPCDSKALQNPPPTSPPVPPLPSSSPKPSKWSTVLLLPPITLRPSSGSKTYKIRLSTPSDYTFIGYLRLSVFKTLPPNVQDLFVTRSRDVMSRRRELGSRIIVAEESTSHQLIGSAELSLHEFEHTPVFSTSEKPLGYVTEVCVAGGFRERGVATRVMEGVEVVACKMGLRGIVLHVEKGNVKARGVYERCGYESWECEGGGEGKGWEEFKDKLGLGGGKHITMRKDLGGAVWGGVKGELGFRGKDLDGE